MTLLPVPACFVPGLLSPLESLSPSPCPPFPTLQPRVLPGRCCRSQALHARELSWGAVYSCLSCCCLQAALQAGEWSSWELPAPLGLPLQQGAGSISSWEFGGSEQERFPLIPAPLLPEQASVQAGVFLPFLHLPASPSQEAALQAAASTVSSFLPWTEGHFHHVSLGQASQDPNCHS